MSAVCILTPIVVASWPVLASAIVGAATAMGFTIRAEALHQERPHRRKVETDIPNSEVVADELARGEKIVVQRGEVTVEFGRDERGACTVCVTGDKLSDRELRKIGEEVAGRVVQQFAYHKLMTELKKRNYTVVGEQVLEDQSVHMRVRL
jgi:hypothetical protein